MDLKQSRRDFLHRAGGDLGAIALTWLLAQEAAGAEAVPSPWAPKPTHFAPKAKRIIQIFCCGGVSHLDTFDYKPDLAKHDGKTLDWKGQLDVFFGKPGALMKSPWDFRQRGQSGRWVSELLPHLASCADDMTFVHSMVAQNSNHTPATFQMNTGFTRNGFPCLGSWLSYGLGTVNQDLPAFVVLPDSRGLPAGGAINWTNGFLPAAHQGVGFRTVGDPIPDLATPGNTSAGRRAASAGLLRHMNQEFLQETPGDTAIAARLTSYELAARMQMSVPEVVDFSKEPEETRKLYGLDNPVCEGFGRNCLLARRLLERGVRFVMLFNGGAFGSPRINWDAHEDVVDNHTKQAAVMDQPVAGLLKDLKRRGMLEDTLLVWNTEFGRTPITQGIGERGRDHHANVFTCWMAGAGLKKGASYGASDEVGWSPAENVVTIPDLHATILHLLGVDHKKLTFYHNGINRRLTDVHGHVVDGLLA